MQSYELAANELAEHYTGHGQGRHCKPLHAAATSAFTGGNLRYCDVPAHLRFTTADRWANYTAEQRLDSGQTAKSAAVVQAVALAALASPASREGGISLLQTFTGSPEPPNAAPAQHRLTLRRNRAADPDQVVRAVSVLTWRDRFLEDRDELHSVPGALSSLGRCRLPRSTLSGIIFLPRDSVGASHGGASVGEE